MKRNAPRLLAALLFFALSIHAVSAGGARFQASTVGKVTEYLSKKSGVRILASASARDVAARMPTDDEKVTAESVEGFVQFIVKNMPDGAIYAKLYLPDPPKGKDWPADDVIAFALAQSKLFGTVGVPRDDGKVEILSQLLPPDKAKDVITALGLKPVYIVTMSRGNFTGAWSATFGELTLRQSGSRVTGNYTTNQGEITGTVNGDVLRFRWFERANGTSGQGMWTLSKDGDSFKGIWINDGESGNQTKEWSGTRIKRDR